MTRERALNEWCSNFSRLVTALKHRPKTTKTEKHIKKKQTGIRTDRKGEEGKIQPDTPRSILQEFVKDLQAAYGTRGIWLDSEALGWPDLETTYWKAIKLLKGPK